MMMRFMRTTDWAIAALVFVLCGCGGGTSTPVSGSSPAAKEAPATPAGAAFNVGSIFPPGEGRDLVLSTCSSCHSVTCSARGQRTAEQWEGIRKSHQDKLTGQPVVSVETMFSYLKANFNETKPEPKVPAELAEQGCTPF